VKRRRLAWAADQKKGKVVNLQRKGMWGLARKRVYATETIGDIGKRNKRVEEKSKNVDRNPNRRESPRSEKKTRGRNMHQQRKSNPPKKKNQHKEKTQRLQLPRPARRSLIPQKKTEKVQKNSTMSPMGKGKRP